MAQKYSIYELIGIFELYAIRFESHFKELSENHLIQYGEKFPYEDFNISSALATIVKEIYNLKSESESEYPSS